MVPVRFCPVIAGQSVIPRQPIELAEKGIHAGLFTYRNGRRLRYSMPSPYHSYSGG